VDFLSSHIFKLGTGLNSPRNVNLSHYLAYSYSTASELIGAILPLNPGAWLKMLHDKLKRCLRPLPSAGRQPIADAFRMRGVQTDRLWIVIHRNFKTGGLCCDVVMRSLDL